MSDTAARARRKPAKGGAPNLVLVNASAETVPAALHGIAHAVTVLMPWGGLLWGVALAAPDVCGGLRTLARPGASLEVASRHQHLGGRRWPGWSWPACPS